LKGSFLTSRAIFKHDIWKNPLDFRLFFYLYGNAVFKEIEHNGVTLKRGQFIKSLRALQKDLEYTENRKTIQYSLSVLKRAIERLEGLDMIRTDSSQLGTLFTIINYEKFQSMDYYRDETAPNMERKLEHQKTGTWNTEKEPESLEPQGIEELKNGNMEHQKTGTWNGSWNNKNNVFNNNNLDVINKAPKKVVNLYDNYILNYGRHLTRAQRDQINSYLDDGMSDDVICYAIEKASLKTDNHAYLMAIVNNWYKEGVREIDQAKKKDLEHEQKIRGRRTDDKGSLEHETSGIVENKNKRKDFGF
jgi:DnaD/phage-associated family protein